LGITSKRVHEQGRKREKGTSSTVFGKMKKHFPAMKVLENLSKSLKLLEKSIKLCK